MGDKCRDDNGCRDPSYCDGKTPQCPPSVNKPNKTICNNEFVCYMGVSISLFIYDKTIDNISTFLINFRNVPVLFVLLTVSNLANVFRVRMIARQKLVIYVVRNQVKINSAKAHATGTNHLSMCQTCLPKQEHHAMITMDIVMFSIFVAKLIRLDRWQHFVNYYFPMKVLPLSKC